MTTVRDDPTLRAFAGAGPQPSETDEQFSRRRFGGQTWPCRRCGEVMIGWPGICDGCDGELAKTAQTPRTIGERLEVAGVPAQYRGVRWETRPEIVQGAKITSALRGWPGSPAIFIHGPVGSGKSCAAVCIVKDGLARGKRARFLYVPAWIDDMRNLERDGGSHIAVETVARFHGLVVLDELVTSRTTDLGRDVLLRVIEHRTAVGLPLIATSNLPLRGSQSVADVLDDRIASRLARGWVVHWAGPDQRRGLGTEIGWRKPRPEG